MGSRSDQAVVAVDVESGLSPLHLPDAESVARAAVAAALEYGMQKTGSRQEDALLGLRQGDGRMCGYFRYGLAKQVSEALGALDESIKAVYLLEYDATPEDTALCTASLSAPLHLIIWAERRTGALDAAVSALDGAVARQVAALAQLPLLRRLLDVQVVDDASVEQRIGYGALLTSVRYPPLRLWSR